MPKTITVNDIVKYLKGNTIGTYVIANDDSLTIVSKYFRIEILKMKYDKGIYSISSDCSLEEITDTELIEKIKEGKSDILSKSNDYDDWLGHQEFISPNSLKYLTDLAYKNKRYNLVDLQSQIIVNRGYIFSMHDLSVLFYLPMSENNKEVKTSISPEYMRMAIKIMQLFNRYFSFYVMDKYVMLKSFYCSIIIESLPFTQDYPMINSLLDVMVTNVLRLPDNILTTIKKFKVEFINLNLDTKRFELLGKYGVKIMDGSFSLEVNKIVKPYNAILGALGITDGIDGKHLNINAKYILSDTLYFNIYEGHTSNFFMHVNL